MSVKPRTNLILDALILIVFGVVMVTGLLMSTGLVASGGSGGGHGLGRGHALETTTEQQPQQQAVVERHDVSLIHEWASYLLIALIVVHLFVHWKWIVCQTRKLLGRSPAPRRTKPPCVEA